MCPIDELSTAKERRLIQQTSLQLVCFVFPVHWSCANTLENCSIPFHSSIVLPNITYALSVYGASESELTMAQQFLDRCFKRRYISKKLEIGELLKVQDHRICRKVSSIPNHPLRANFPETKITRYNLRNKPPAMPAIHTDRFKNTFFYRIVFKYNVPL